MDEETEMSSCDDRKSTSSDTPEKSSSTVIDSCQGSADKVKVIQHFAEAVKLSSPEGLNAAVHKISADRVRRFLFRYMLRHEINVINQTLSDVSVELDSNQGAAVLSGGSEGICVIFSFILLPIRPLRLLIPADYPVSSPVIKDDSENGLQDNLIFSWSLEPDLSRKINQSFCIYLIALPEPMSLEAMARAWDISIREVLKKNVTRKI